ncbi:MAG: lamin tail domain-containing protein [Verrucomicrobiia bacterium]
MSRDIEMRIKAVLFIMALLVFYATKGKSQLYLPNDVYTVVNGYQDDFEGTSLKPGWLIRGASVYSVNNGVLRVSSASGDPNHLLYTGATYNNSVQEVLMRIRFLNFGTGDPPRGGAAVCVDPNASPAGGIDYHFRDNNGRALAFLDDLRAWGPSQSFQWQNNVWYWVRLRHEPNAASQGGAYDVFGKIWQADGSTPEPSNWQLMWDYIPTRTARTGYAGIAAGSSGGISEFEVDYILIKASGLPQITVTPQSFVQVPVTITNQPQDVSVVELMPAAFTVGVYGVPMPTLQWYKNGQPIQGATNAVYSIPSVSISENQSQFYVVAINVVSNTTYSVTSRVAILYISLDEDPPQLVGARSLSIDEIEVLFSEWVAEESATNLTNYSLINSDNNQHPIISATLLDDYKRVLLKVPSLAAGSTYTLSVTGISDRASENNTMSEWHEAVFRAPLYQSTNIGGALPPGGISSTQNGFILNGGGAAIGGVADQFSFFYQVVDNDFDVMVRVESFQAANNWAKVGIMARESLEPGGRFAAVLATPIQNGAFMTYRTITNGQTAAIGAYPLNFPYTYLRLKRSNNEFSAYAGIDGKQWTLLGITNIAMNFKIYLGFAISSAEQGVNAAAVLKDFSTVAKSRLVPQPTYSEPLGQTTRRTPLVFSEIMYNPYSPGAASYEFVELYNSSPTPEEIGGYKLRGDISYTFPLGTVIPAGGFLVIAKNPSDITSKYGVTNVVGPYNGSLPNDGGTIKLLNQAGAVMLEVNYKTRPPWPVAADGTGHSLVLKRPSLGLNNPRAWSWSDRVGGSPGRAESFTPTPLRNVVINEFLAASQTPNLDFIELYNHSNEPVDVSGCYLADNKNPLSPDSQKFRIPNGTVIPPRGFVVFNQNQMGLALNSAGESIVLWNPQADMIIDAVRFEAQDVNVSSGRYPDGADEFYPLKTPTPGATNNGILISDVVINEIMYAPISRDADDEYVELYNRGTNVVDISGWRFVDGIEYTFPSNTFIRPGQYIVVAKNVSNLLSKYPQLNSSNTFGNFSGSLANGGERLALAKWRDVVASNLLVSPLSPKTATGSLVPPQQRDFIIPTNANYLIGTNRIYIVVDEVTYNVGGEWGEWSHFGGSSLELIDPNSNKRLPSNWADSDETRKAEWTDFSFTGYVDNGITSAADQLQVLLQGAGECLIDNIEVVNSSGQNVITNSTFETGAGGWFAEGTHELSSLETAEGYQSARSYHIRADDRGDNQVNRVRVNLSSALAANTTATIRGKARWLRGFPELLLRIRGCWLETLVSLKTPVNPGTPGLPNSRLVTNAPPAIYEVTHSPVVPAANQDVVVTARVCDPDGIYSINLNYRIDPSTNYYLLPMVDDGTGGDEVAGDGIYSATIPGQPAGRLIAFYISASDFANPSNIARYPKTAPSRECLVLFGDSTPTGNFPVYRLWMTQAVFNKWSNRHKLHNSPLPITFVIGNYRVIYGASGLFSGSPYIAPGFNTPTGNRCGYAISFPPDDEFLGDTDLQIDWPGGHGGETTAIQEQMAYWIADRLNLPNSYRYFIRLNVNGVTDMQRGGIFEAVFQPGGEYIKQWSPDNPAGDFYKIERAFEFDDSGNRIADPMPRLENYVSADGSKKTARYRWNWLKRNYDSVRNYTNIFQLVDAANASQPEPFTTRMNQLADMEQWMGVFAFEHIINNFDSWGHTIGKNMYAFKPDRARWVLYPFDLDWLMLVSPRGPGGYTATTGPLFVADDPLVVKMYNHPPFRRAYLRYVYDAAYGPLQNSVADPVMDAKYRALVANGITMCDGSALTDPSAVKSWFNDRRNFLLATLASNSCSFAVIYPTNNFSTNNNLLRIEGTAPVTVAKIVVNGISLNLNWTTVSNWYAYYPLNSPTNTLNIAAYTHKGEYVDGSSNTFTVFLTTQPEEPRVVITEIMYNPTIPGASFIELYNPSETTTVDLSDWKILGLSYKFSKGALLLPKNYLVLAKDRYAFAINYGSDIIVFDQFDGSLNNNGEVITVVRPTPQGDRIVDRVRYESSLPWSQKANGGGYSLQLIDPDKDNSRLLNWTDGDNWRFFYFTGTLAPTTKRLMLFPDVAGEIYIDDVKLVAGSVPEVGENLIRGGDFEGVLWTNQGGFWGIVGTAGATTEISTNISHTGNGSLHIRFTSPGGGSQYLFTDAVIATTNTYTLSFWYLASTNINKLTTRFSSSFRPEINVRPIYSTPGTNNSTFTFLPDIPPVWLNELQAENITGIVDNYGQRDPWIEIYNSGTNAVDISGWALTDDYDDLSKWIFPSETTIPAGGFLIVWADGEPQQTQGANLHANFRLTASNGMVILSMPINGKLKPLDYLNYKLLLPDYSYGNRQGDEPFFRNKFRTPTPGAPNGFGQDIPQLVINELMPDNDGIVNDLINGGAPDWIELYNMGTNVVDLSGFFLTDDLSDIFKFEIPDGYIIPARGFMIAWADNSPSRNNPQRDPALHLNFALRRNGETIALFAPDGTLVDSVIYESAGENESIGRYPDGSGSIYKLIQPTPGSTNALPMIQTNYPPVITVQEQYFVSPGQTLNFIVQAIDVDIPAQFLHFSLSNAPTGATINQTTGEFLWQVPTNYPLSTNLITVIVTDDGIPPQTSQATFKVIVSTANTPPLIQHIDDQIVNEGMTLYVMVQATDPDTPPQQLSYSLDLAPPGAFINPQTGVFQWTPTELQGPGIYNVIVRVTDSGAPQMSSTATFKITVNEINSAPVLLPVATRYVIIGQQLTVQLIGTDSDVPVQNLQYSLEPGAPAGITLNPISGILIWTPTATDIGTNIVSVRVSDDGTPAMSDVKSFSIVVGAKPKLEFSRVGSNGDMLKISFDSLPDKRYQVEYTDNLGLSWLTNAILNGTGSKLSITNSFTPQKQRFFRVGVQ